MFKIMTCFTLSILIASVFILGNSVRELKKGQEVQQVRLNCNSSVMLGWGAVIALFHYDAFLPEPDLEPCRRYGVFRATGELPEKPQEDAASEEE